MPTADATLARIRIISSSMPETADGRRSVYSRPSLIRRAMSLFRVSIFVSRNDWRDSRRHTILSSVTFVSNMVRNSPSVESPKREPFWLSRLSVDRWLFDAIAFASSCAPPSLIVLPSRLSVCSPELAESPLASAATPASSMLHADRLRSVHAVLLSSAFANCGSSSCTFIESTAFFERSHVTSVGSLAPRREMASPGVRDLAKKGIAN